MQVPNAVTLRLKIQIRNKIVSFNSVVYMLRKEVCLSAVIVPSTVLRADTSYFHSPLSGMTKILCKLAYAGSFQKKST